VSYRLGFQSDVRSDKVFVGCVTQVTLAITKCPNDVRLADREPR